MTEGDGAQLATNMKLISIDLNGMQPKRLLDSLFQNRTELRSINLINLTTEGTGLVYFNELPRMNALKELKLNFGRLRDADIKKQAKNYRFAPGSCPSLESLQIQYQVVGKGVSIANQSWMDFFGMFSGLKNFTLIGASGTEEPTFWPRVLSSMPALKALELRQCQTNAQVLESLAVPMTDPNCQITHLTFDYAAVDAVNKSVKVRKPPTFDPIEALL